MLIVAIMWLLVIFSTVKFYRQYKKSKLAFVNNDLDSTKSS